MAAAGADATLAVARDAVRRFGLGEGCVVDLLNVSENHTYRVDDSDGRRYALRLHRPGYRTADQIESELAWTDALSQDGVVETPPVVAAPDGGRVVTASADGAEPRYAVLFEWLSGSEPGLDDGPVAIERFAALGAITARMHGHVRGWSPPTGFTRPRWDHEYTLGPRGHWGRWQDGLGIGAQELALLTRVDQTIAARLRAFGQGPERFGLVHADLRLANLLVDAGDVRVIDFDDCGFSWFVYDFATAVSFIEDDPRVPELRDAWLRGYRTVADLEPAAETELDTAVMLRRMLLVAWVGSHHTFATEAAELGAGFTVGTCALAETYLSNHGSRGEV
jgi:Ser/Thr protein kinase RdoA (MazF antagonist)